MNVQNKKKSSYVIIGNPSFLSSGGEDPPMKEVKPPLALREDYREDGDLIKISKRCSKGIFQA